MKKILIFAMLLFICACSKRSGDIHNSGNKSVKKSVVNRTILIMITVVTMPVLNVG